MHKSAIPGLAVGAMLFSAIVSYAAPVPCEDALKDLRALEATAKPVGDVKTRVDDLMAKGIERCKADDDKRADAFFAEATKLLGK